jgi:phosphatidylserine decarboxylase
MLDTIVNRPPGFFKAKDEHGNVIGEPIGVPLYLLFDLLSNTAAAFDLFRKPAFNVALKELLNSWGQYLTTEDSNKTLTDEEGGWFSDAGIEMLEYERGVFNATYITPDASAINRGYRSWDEFFTREVQPDARPILFPENKTLIHNACESTVYRIAYRVKAHDRFWLKNQSYSLYNMLNRDELAEKFVDGTIYQAFLSPQDYHRWRSPIDGTIVKAYVVPGTYYAVLPDAGAEKDDPDLKEGDPHGALIRSQAWITQSAARALIFIQADNPAIGLVGFIGVGMAEVSTCDITVKEQQKVSAGDELGMFHFGGSSHTLIFGPQVQVVFRDIVELDKHIHVNTVIAQVHKA